MAQPGPSKLGHGEVVYVHDSGPTLYHVTNVGAYVTQLVAADGTAIQVDTAVGVA